MQDHPIVYHSIRITQELEQAEQASTPAVVAAHRALAELHLDRLADASDYPSAAEAPAALH